MYTWQIGQRACVAEIITYLTLQGSNIILRKFYMNHGQVLLPY